MNTIFFGTPQFAADVLSFLLQNGVPISAVITKPDRPQGRSGAPVPTPVKRVAEQHGIPVYQPVIVSDLDFMPTLEKYQPDLFVVVAYGEIIKQHLLDMPKVGCINLHASLLPKFRGAAPIQRSIIEGEKETGVTIMHMVKKMDAGDMIQTVVVPIEDNTTYGELEAKLCQVGSQALLQTIHDFEQGKITRIPQDHSKATLAPKIELEDCEIFWEQPAQKIHNMVRGVNPHPGAWCYVDVKGEKKRLKVLKTEVRLDLNGQPGQILNYNKNGLVIGCGENALKLIEVQLEGKKAMPTEELVRGIPIEKFKIIKDVS